MSFRKGISGMLVVFACAALMIAPATAQKVKLKSFQPFVEAGVGATAASLGYKNPDYIVGGGFEYSSSDLLIVAKADYLSADIKQVRSGTTVKAEAAAYLRIGPIVAGGGVTRSALYTNRFEQGNVKPVVGAGIDVKRFRLLGQFEFAGSDIENHANRVGYDAQIKINRHFRVRQSSSAYLFNVTNQPHSPRSWGGEVSAGVILLL